MNSSKTRINVTKTYLPDIDKFKSYVDRIFASNWVTNHSQLVQELEERLKDHLGVKNIILVANGTLALQIAYKILNLKGSVITTPFSFVATTSSLVWEGLNPIFVDIDKDTFCIDPDKIEESILPDTSAIVPVHVYGQACEIEIIQEIANRNKLKIVYDASHSFGIKYKVRSILEHGDISTLSFHATKIFHTCEGGALIINDDSLYRKAKLMIDFGVSAHDRIEGLGINAKMNEFEAAMGLCVLDDWDYIIKAREKVFQYYKSHLPNNLIFPKWNINSNNNYGYFPVVFESEAQLLRVKKALNDINIFPRRYFYPSLDFLPYINPIDQIPKARALSSKVLCLPIYEELEIKILEKIISTIQSVI